MTDKKQSGVTEEKKCCGMTGREKTLCCDRKRGIRRSLNIFSSEKMRDDSIGGRLHAIVG